MGLKRFTLTQYLEYVKPLFTATLDELVLYEQPLTPRRIKVMFRYEENLPAMNVGQIVDIFTRTRLTATPDNPFPLLKVMKASDYRFSSLASNRKLAKENVAIATATEVNRQSILAVYRALHKTQQHGRRKPLPPISPNRKTINNIMRMVDIGANWLQTLPALQLGVKLSAEGFNTLYPTRVDYVSEDTLWDMVVSEYPPSASQLLKLMAYDILAFDTPALAAREFTSVGILNPRLGYRYWLPCKEFPVDAYDALRGLLKSEAPSLISG